MYHCVFPPCVVLFLHRVWLQGTPRTRFLVVSCTLACVACAVGALSSPLLVLPVSIMSGLAFGGCWALLPALAADLFGVKHLASNYCLVQLAPACGRYFQCACKPSVTCHHTASRLRRCLLANCTRYARLWREMFLLFLPPRQAYGRAHGDPPGTCVGRACYGVALVISTGACGVGVGAAMLLDRSAKAVYLKEHEELHAWDEVVDD